MKKHFIYTIYLINTMMRHSASIYLLFFLLLCNSLSIKAESTHLYLSVNETATIYLPSGYSEQGYWSNKDPQAIDIISGLTSPIMIKVIKYVEHRCLLEYKESYGSHRTFSVFIDIRKPSDPDNPDDPDTSTDKSDFKYTYNGVEMSFVITNQTNKECSLSSGTNEVAAVKTYNSHIVEIPEEVNGYKVTSIGDYAMWNCRGIYKVVIPKSVKEIGFCGLCGCNNLEDVAFSSPSSLKSLGRSAFAGCKKLESIELPNSVTVIGENGFYMCDNLKCVIVGDSVKNIGMYAFKNELTSFYISTLEVPTTNQYAFYEDWIKSRGKLYVPSQSIEAYRNSHPWSSFKYFIDIEQGEIIYVTEVKLNETNISLYPGNTKQLTATIYPNNASCKKLSWVSNNTSVAQVNDDGLVTANAIGSATITCKANDGSGKQATCTIIVNNDKPYAVLSENNTKLTFYYDDKMSERGGISVYSRTYFYPDWCEYNKNITHVVFDNSFANCKTLTSTKFWFYQCETLTTITGINNLNTSNVTDMGDMFFYCSALTNLDVSHFDTSNVTYMGGMFAGCKSLTKLDVSHFNTSKVTNMGGDTWALDGMFSDCVSLTHLDLSNFDTSNVKDMNGLFYHCSALTSLDLSSFNTSNVTDMGSMFGHCSALTSLDLSSFNTSNVTDMKKMFEQCSALTGLDLSNFDTSNVTNMSSMFSGCKMLSSLNVSKFNTAKVTDMSYMFCQNYKLTNLNLRSFNTSNVTNMYWIFALCSSITNLDLTSFNTTNVTKMYGAFESCSKLTSIYVGERWSVKNLTDEGNNMFDSCTSLVGGKGTVYDKNHVDHTYARVDGGPNSSTPGYFSDGCDPSGIQGILNNNHAIDGPVFNLSGQRLTAPQKGINIINGKKYVVK